MGENLKSEYRNPKQIQNSKEQKNSKQARRGASAVLKFESQSFGFVSKFDIRISSFFP
jgi:hypothetical protein